MIIYGKMNIKVRICLVFVFLWVRLKEIDSWKRFVKYRGGFVGVGGIGTRGFFIRSLKGLTASSPVGVATCTLHSINAE